MNHLPLSSIRYGALMAALVITMTGLTVQAAEPEHAGITPAQREQVQAVGRTILMSMRHAKRSAESEAIRKQVNQAKARLDALMAPASMSKITLLSPSSTGSGTPAGAAVPMSAHAKAQVWRHDHAAQLAELDTAMMHIKTQSDALLKRRMPPKPGFWRHLWARIAGSPPARPKPSVVTSLSDAALTRLSLLQSKVNAALALPEAERHQRLAALSEQLTIRHHFPRGAREQTRETPKEETPTFISRTTHRHPF